MVQQPGLSCWFQGSPRKEPGRPGYTPLSEALNEREGRKMLDAEVSSRFPG